MSEFDGLDAFNLFLSICSSWRTYLRISSLMVVYAALQTLLILLLHFFFSYLLMWFPYFIFPRPWTSLSFLDCQLFVVPPL